MKICSFGDLHLKQGPRLEDQRACLSACIDDMLKEGPDLFLCLGDLYGTATPYKPNPIERGIFEPALRRMADAAPVVVIRGNHDDTETIKRLEDIAGSWPVRTITGAEVLEVGTPCGEIANVFGLSHPSARWMLSAEDGIRGLQEVQAAVQQRLSTLLMLWRLRIARARETHPGRVHVVAMHIQIGASVASGGECLASNEIELSRGDLADLGADAVLMGHIHKSQCLAPRVYYTGSLYRNSFAETETKGWHLATVDGRADGADRTTVEFIPSPCRDFVTLDFRWAADKEGGEPRWVERPDALRLGCEAGLRTLVEGAEVRARLVVPDTQASSVPWEAELERVKAAGAHRVVAERTVEPTVRARAPELQTAESNTDRLGVYWGTLSSPPIEVEQAAALEVLAELESYDDEDIRKHSDEMGAA